MKRVGFGVLAILALSGGEIHAAPVKKAAANTKVKPATKAVSAKKEAAELLTYHDVQSETLNSCADVKKYARSLITGDMTSYWTAKAVNKSLSDIDFTQGEYETTAELSDRKASALSLYFGNPKKVAFVGWLTDDGQKYNADNEELTLHLPRKSYGSEDAIVSLSFNRKELGILNGQTALGIKFKYRSYIDIEEKLVLGGVDKASYQPVKEDDVTITDVTLKIPRDRAIQIRSRLKYAIFGQIVSPYHTKSLDEDVASLDNPINEVTSTDTYYLRPRCVFIFDSTTGDTIGTMLDVPFEQASTSP